MKYGWKIKSFSDLVDIIGGGTPKTSIEEYWNGSIPWISIKDFNNDLKFIEFTEKSITELGLEKSSTKVLNSGDSIISARGTVGEVAMINSPMAFNQSCYGIRSLEDVDNGFIYYLLKYNINKLKNNVHGSVFDTITTNTFDNIIVEVPPLEEQVLINEILSNIDNKILVNKKINNNLEKSLMLLYNSWFELFDSYDKSKGMKDTEDFGEIPCSWNVEMLEDYVDFVTGVEPGSKNYHEINTGNLIPFIRVGDLGSRDNMVFIEEKLSKNKIIFPEDIVVSMDATIGIVKMGLFGAYSSGMRKLVIKNDKINKPFLFCLINSLRIQRIIQVYASGTTILHAGKSIKHMNFVLPNSDLMNKFNRIGNPILSEILNNIKEIEELVNLRNSLLPKLMSGEIDVSKIKI